MLRGIPHILSPELLEILCEMGHSDRIVIVDGSFPAESMDRDTHVIHTEGHGVPEILEAILSLFPLDTYAECPVCPTSVTGGGTVETSVWDQYMTLVETCDSRDKSVIGYIERFVFYGETKKTYAIIAISEEALYTSIILQRGIVTDQGL